MQASPLRRRFLRLAAALSTLCAAAGALAHAGHPAIGGPLEHVHAERVEPDLLLAMIAAGVLSALLLAVLRRLARERGGNGWRGAAAGALQGAAVAGLAVGASGIAMLLARL